MKIMRIIKNILIAITAVFVFGALIVAGIFGRHLKNTEQDKKGASSLSLQEGISQKEKNISASTTSSKTAVSLTPSSFPRITFPIDISRAPEKKPGNQFTTTNNQFTTNSNQLPVTSNQPPIPASPPLTEETRNPSTALAASSEQETAYRVQPHEISEEAKQLDNQFTTTSNQLPITNYRQPYPASPPLPPLNEDALMRAVVRIQCGNIYGSGIIVNSEGLVLTVAHVIISAIEAGASECDVIFPKKHPEFNFYSETYYRKGVIIASTTTATLYKEKSLDVAALRIRPLPDDPVFPDGYPFVNMPFCGTDILDDEILLFGYAANVGTSADSPGSVLSRFSGGVLQFADITGVRKEPSSISKNGNDFFPNLAYSLDENMPHPIVIIFSNNNFSGASGGLAFNASKQCIVGTNSAVGTSTGDPRIFGVIYNFEFPDIKSWREIL